MWRLTDSEAVLYTNDRPTLQAVLGYTRFPHNDLSGATTYANKKGKVFAWQFTFPAGAWNGVVRHLGRSAITILDEEKPRQQARGTGSVLSGAAGADRKRTSAQGERPRKAAASRVSQETPVPPVAAKPAPQAEIRAPKPVRAKSPAANGTRVETPSVTSRSAAKARPAKAPVTPGVGPPEPLPVQAAPARKRKGQPEPAAKETISLTTPPPAPAAVSGRRARTTPVPETAPAVPPTQTGAKIAPTPRPNGRTKAGGTAAPQAAEAEARRASRAKPAPAQEAQPELGPTARGDRPATRRSTAPEAAAIATASPLAAASAGTRQSKRTTKPAATSAPAGTAGKRDAPAPRTNNVSLEGQPGAARLRATGGSTAPSSPVPGPGSGPGQAGNGRARDAEPVSPPATAKAKPPSRSRKKTPAPPPAPPETGLSPAPSRSRGKRDPAAGSRPVADASVSIAAPKRRRSSEEQPEGAPQPATAGKASRKRAGNPSRSAAGGQIELSLEPVAAAAPGGKRRAKTPAPSMEAPPASHPALGDGHAGRAPSRGGGKERAVPAMPIGEEAEGTSPGGKGKGRNGKAARAALPALAV
jgi:hypothetical protein